MSGMVNHMDDIVSHYVEEKEKAKFDKLELIEDDVSIDSLDSEKMMEVRYFKEKLLQYVEHIVKRQDSKNPLSKMETFEVETASRRVLKELLEEFAKIRDDQTKNISQIQAADTWNKRKIEYLENGLGKMQRQMFSTTTFEKRLGLIEVKL